MWGGGVVNAKQNTPISVVSSLSFSNENINEQKGSSLSTTMEVACAVHKYTQFIQYITYSIVDGSDARVVSFVGVYNARTYLWDRHFLCVCGGYVCKALACVRSRATTVVKMRV